ncbi:hypothetical protein OHB05_29605 [Streptomyces sp. NBC_00638]|uniref:hypothetical protein n=1 Tax=Streptomyces sp. NBC_00638 TaxID=2975794 RepID=UPI0022540005|nr:hypothetical protein [Streptomyces sp. NBC_00638]MCX5006745.1 hypothetical protein [Streptomyces sp. NBC_00638]
MSRGIVGRWFVAVLVASAVLTAGCTAQVDAEDLPGVYRNGKTGGEIRLDSDGTFTATDLSTDAHSDPADFHGQWEFVDSSGSDFVYLDIDERGIGEVSGVQLYARGGGKVEFSLPDGSWSLVLTKVSAQ